MYCYRDDGFVKQGDVVFLAQCDAAIANAIVRVLTYGEIEAT